MLSSHYAEQATYDSAGLDPYTLSGAGASMLWFNQSSTAAKDIDAGLELFVNYGPSEQQLTMYILFVLKDYVFSPPVHVDQTRQAVKYDQEKIMKVKEITKRFAKYY